MYKANSVKVDEKISPSDVIDMDTVIPFMAVKCDNLTTSSQTYYIHVSRGSYEGMMYFNLSINERIKTGSGSFSFPGIASNSGNTTINPSGVNSSILSLNLANNASIPFKAMVKRATTSGTQNPNQGNVRHMILPETPNSTWYSSVYTSATNGSYSMNISNNIEAKKTWQFRYNALATAKSTMSNVKLNLEWEYDLENTNYKSFR